MWPDEELDECEYDIVRQLKELYMSCNAKDLVKQAREANRLRAAIVKVRSQRADDLCWRDLEELYAAVGDGVKGDFRVGSKEAMLKNCARYVQNCCIEGGPWKTYAQLEEENKDFRKSLAVLFEYLEGAGVGHSDGCKGDLDRDCDVPTCERLLIHNALDSVFKWDVL